MNNSNEIICTAFHRFLKLKFQIIKRLKNCNGTEYIPSEKFDDYHVNYYETTMSTLPVYDFTRARVNVIEDYCNITIPIPLEIVPNSTTTWESTGKRSSAGVNFGRHFQNFNQLRCG